MCTSLFSEEKVSSLREVTVRGDFSKSVSVSVISKEQIQRSGAKNILEALSGSVGVHSVSKGVVPSISIRGSLTSQVLILHNGIPVTSLESAMDTLSLFNVEEVERIEVYRGAYYLFLDQNAIGGVINVVTKGEIKTPFLYKVTASSFRNVSLFLKTAMPIKKTSHQVGYKIALNQNRFRYYSPHYERFGFQDHAQSLLSYGGYDGSWEDPLPFIDHISAGLSYVYDDKNLWGFDSAPTPDANMVDQIIRFYTDVAFLDKVRRKTMTLDLHYDLLFHDRNYLNDERIIGGRIHPNSGVYTYDKHFLELGYQFFNPVVNAHVKWNFTHHHFFSDHDGWITGAHFERNREEMSLLAALDKTVYGINFFSSLAVLLHSFKRSNVKAMVGINAEVVKNWVFLKGSYQRQLREPSFSDVFWSENAVSVHKEKLKPEKSQSVDSELEINLFYMRLNGSFYYKWVRDLITWVRLANAWTPINESETHIMGAETELRTASFYGVHLEGNYAYVREWNANPKSSDYGKRLPNVPIHKATETLVYESPYGFGLSSSYTYIGKMFLTPGEIKYRKPIHLLGLSLWYNPLHQIRVQLTFSNLLNVLYQDMRAMPGGGFEARFETGGYL